ncbi:hypothetical protein AVEN_176206-1 [Araneus ventricosus]|uniref:RNase H type-1 domain-containing protein n=1 Tax=Araneus ventricosus TaxID=182803 RepID=A0A4Y2LR60_ARAVE|nr:hypothetical protein AVEN_176206-1 [Araneus ventricosus]
MEETTGINFAAYILKLSIQIKPDNPNRCTPSAHRSSTPPPTNPTRSNLCPSCSIWSERSKPFCSPIHLTHIPPHIHLKWLKAHVGYLGNQCADQLAKEVITKDDPFFLPKPLYYLKSEIRSAALSIWQDDWDNRETGRSTHDIVPGVPIKPVGWNREELMFVTGHGPFPSYLHRFNLRTHDNCSCGEKGDTMHYATKCRFTFWHFQTPTVSIKLQWLKNILTNKLIKNPTSTPDALHMC